MKWFRSNIRLGSRLALFALTIQFLLSFGHFHGGNAQAAPAFVDAKQSGRPDTVSRAWDRASPAHVSGAVLPKTCSLKTCSDDESDGQETDHCAICAVMALADTIVVATPPFLLGPQAAAFSYLTADVGSVGGNFARVAFQPRAPPVS